MSFDAKQFQVESSPSVCTLFNVTIIQVYASTSDYSDEETDELYEHLQNVIEQVAKRTYSLYKTTGMQKLEKMLPRYGMEFAALVVTP